MWSRQSSGSEIVTAISILLVTLGSADENAARMAGIAGLDADTAVIAPKQLVVIGKRPARADRSFGRDDRAELCVLQRCLRKVGQIECSGEFSPLSSPCGLAKCVCVRPSARARRFIWRTNAASLPETEIASVRAASLPEWSIMP